MGASSVRGLVSGDMVHVTKQVLDLEEWDLVLSKLLRFHANIQQECGIIVQTIRKEMKSELVPLAEEKATYGKIVKSAIRELWAMGYEIEEIQTEFAKGIGSIDIANLTDDFVEDVMLQSKPLQGILMAIRLRQKERMEAVQKAYWDQIKDLEPLNLARPPKPAPVEKKAEPAAEPAPAAAPAPAPAVVEASA